MPVYSYSENCTLDHNATFAMSVTCVFSDSARDKLHCMDLSKNFYAEHFNSIDHRIVFVVVHDLFTGTVMFFHT
jgi:hypothetical protein